VTVCHQDGDKNAAVPMRAHLVRLLLLSGPVAKTIQPWSPRVEPSLISTDFGASSDLMLDRMSNSGAFTVPAVRPESLVLRESRATQRALTTKAIRLFRWLARLLREFRSSIHEED
jgi:hypothetical protein